MLSNRPDFYYNILIPAGQGTNSPIPERFQIETNWVMVPGMRIDIDGIDYDVRRVEMEVSRPIRKGGEGTGFIPTIVLMRVQE